MLFIEVAIVLFDLGSLLVGQMRLFVDGGHAEVRDLGLGRRVGGGCVELLAAAGPALDVLFAERVEGLVRALEATLRVIGEETMVAGQDSGWGCTR